MWVGGLVGRGRPRRHTDGGWRGRRRGRTFGMFTRRLAAMRLLACCLAAALAATTLAACDGAAEPPKEVGAARTYALAYTVDGTYAACTVRYRAADYETRTVDVRPATSGLDAGRIVWRYEAPLRVTALDGGFGASVAATCADDARKGKVTASVLVDGRVADTQTTADFGATAVASVDLRTGSR